MQSAGGLEYAFNQTATDIDQVCRVYKTRLRLRFNHASGVFSHCESSFFAVVRAASVSQRCCGPLFMALQISDVNC
jgi:hypothetical protein